MSLVFRIEYFTFIYFHIFPLSISLSQQIQHCLINIFHQLTNKNTREILISLSILYTFNCHKSYLFNNYDIHDIIACLPMETPLSGTPHPFHTKHDNISKWNNWPEVNLTKHVHKCNRTDAMKGPVCL